MRFSPDMGRYGYLLSLLIFPIYGQCKSFRPIHVHTLSRQSLSEQTAPSDGHNAIIDTVFPFCTRASCERAVTYMAQEHHHRRMQTALQLLLPPSAPQSVFNLPCMVCGLRSTQIPKRCSCCKLTWYCGPACQKSHWNRHKAECNAGTEGNQ